MKNIWLICSECGYSKEVLENEIYYYNECPLCQGKMVMDLNQGKKIDPEPLGDNFPKLDNKDNLTESEKIMINSLAQEIKEFGEEWVWNNINMIVFEKRLEYIEMFFSAKKLLEKGEY